ncbi:unnamed protein product [Adineta ricciae]|uniref:Uncharacterized protein n=1 Tax=Adineta ricciae TaxID=249248 RepID=A0A816AKN1_ADIRI|nr:unnamed protein product [Adineta ricciae]CAF1598840.1 unnamed protein product [Adineta ricciae]
MATASSSLVKQMQTDVIQETNRANGDDVQKEKELKFRAMFDYSLSTPRYSSLSNWSSSDQLQKRKRLLKHPFYIGFSHATNNQLVLYGQMTSANGQYTKQIIR